MTAAKKLLERGLEVFVDLGEGLFELLARDLIDLLDRGRGVFDRRNQILALGFFCIFERTRASLSFENRRNDNGI